MATEVKQVPEQPIERSTEEKVVDSARDFWGKNNKVITYALAGLVVIVGGYFAYTQFYKKPAEAKAAEAIWKAEDYYRLDSFKLALEGDGQNGGFLKAIKNHSGTKAGNLAQFHAGSCYMQLGDYNNAIKYLRSTDALSWMLVSFCFVNILQAQWGQPTTLGFVVLSTGLAIAALNKPDEEDEEDEEVTEEEEETVSSEL